MANGAIDGMFYDYSEFDESSDYSGPDVFTKAR
jgi:hypothetical protein